MAVKERIAGIRPDEIGRPTGAYRVELLDRHTGRVRERIEKANYITPMLDRWIRWHQAASWHRGLRYVHLGAAQTSYPTDVSPRGYEVPPLLPNESIAALSSTIAANPASDWATGRVIGFGTRWKSSSVPASGPRGQINEAQSEITIDGSKIVFDFNENQGNGTFGSLAIGRVLFSGQARLSLPYGRAKGYVDGDPVALGLNSTGDRIFAGFDANEAFGWDMNVTQVKTFNLVTLPAASVDGVVDCSGLAVASSSPTLSNLLVRSDSLQGVGIINQYGLVSVQRYGGDWIVAYLDGRGNLNLGRWTSAGAMVWQVQALATGGAQSYTTRTGLAIVGTDAYVNASPYSSGWYPVGESVARVRLSDGVVTATYPYGNAADGTTIRTNGGLATDGTDLFASTTEGILRMSTAGAILDNIGDPFTGSITETGVSPWSTLTNAQGYASPTHEREPYSVSAGVSDRSSGSTSGSSLGAGDRVMAFDGKLWAVAATEFFSLDGGTAFSRTVLDLEVTKTVSSTMKWTYELTFPSSWRTLPAHVVPPS